MNHRGPGKGSRKGDHGIWISFIPGIDNPLLRKTRIMLSLS